jgi:hypothetical protein
MSVDKWYLFLLERAHGCEQKDNTKDNPFCHIEINQSLTFYLLAVLDVMLLATMLRVFDSTK